MRVRFFLTLFLEIVIFATVIAQKEDKIHREVKSDYLINNENRRRLVQGWLDSNGILFHDEIDQILTKLSNTVISGHLDSPEYLVRISANKSIPTYLKGQIVWQRGKILGVRNSQGIIRKLITDPSINFVQLNNQPYPETTIPEHDLSVNYIDWFKSAMGYSALNQLVGLKERSADTLDIDLRRKFVLSELADSQFDTHATAMATIIAGRGNSSIKSLGVANNAFLISSSFTNVLPDPDEFLEDISTQNHSYGFNVQNEYDILAQAYDESVNDDPYTLHVFSAGNLGLTIPENGPYNNLGNVSNLSGGIKQAKNTLVIGATNKLYEVDERSSRGPAYDGRIKPELVAYGAEGTSEAAALVSGSAALLQEMVLNVHDVLAENYLLKAILISSATDVEYPGPDYTSGFGSLNMYNASEVIKKHQFVKQEIEDQGVYETVLSVPSEKRSIRIALSWNDISAEPGELSALINDLDLEVEYNGVVHRPLVPNSLPDMSLLFEPAIERRDSLNNNELVYISGLSAGEVKIRVKGHSIETEKQKFAISYSYEDQESFEWLIPEQGAAIDLGEPFYLRFQNTFRAPVQLNVRQSDGQWSPIGPIEDNQQLTFEEPGSYELMVNIKGGEIISPTIVVQSKLEFSKLYECEEALLFNWSDVGADTYELHGIDKSTFERTLLFSSTDTSEFLTNDLPGLENQQIAVQPIFNGSNGVQGNLYDFGKDGIGCYVKSFSSSVDNDQVRLDLQLTTDLNVESISFVREQEGRKKEFGATMTSSLNFEGQTSESSNGYYLYKGLIRLSNSELGFEEIETTVIEIPIILDEENVLFPNPLGSGEELFFLGSSDLSRIRLFSADGSYSTVIYVTSNEQFFELKGVASGLYLYQLIGTNEEVIKTGRLIIR